MPPRDSAKKRTRPFDFADRFNFTKEPMMSRRPSGLADPASSALETRKN
jgi:hypothetical protein